MRFSRNAKRPKIPDQAPDVKPREFKTVGVVGSGTMGGGIAMSFVNAGIPVVILDRDQAALSRGLPVVAKNYESMVKRPPSQVPRDRAEGEVAEVAVLRIAPRNNYVMAGLDPAIYNR